MLRYSISIIFIFLSLAGFSQRLITYQDAVNLSLQNKVNNTPATLGLKQQQQLLKATGILNNPEVEIEKSPYEGLLLGIQQRLSFPSVYASQRNLQYERIQLAQLMLQLNENEIKRLVLTNYLQVQYFKALTDFLSYKDSVYQKIKIAAKRNFDAGQINKLQELFAANEADKVRNELNRSLIDLQAQKIAFAYFTNLNESFIVEPLTALPINSVSFVGDTLNNTIQQQIFQQQVSIAEQELKVQRGQLLPEIIAGPLFPLSKDYKQPVGFRFGISLPIWPSQNQARLNAAKTGIQLAEAQRQRENRNLTREYQLAYSNLLKEKTSIDYYKTNALIQSKDIIETALRLFEAGESDYIQALRNMITAFETRENYLQTLRNYNQALIDLKYLNGTL